MKTMISSTRHPKPFRTVWGRRHRDIATGIIIGGLISILGARAAIEPKAAPVATVSTTSEHRICTPIVPVTRTTLASR